jgi:adenylate kinase
MDKVKVPPDGPGRSRHPDRSSGDRLDRIEGSERMRAVLLGPPGAGKGTQGPRLAAEFGVAHVATGDIFRAHAARQTRLGRTAQEYMDQGELVPDEIVISMVSEKLAEPGCRPGFVLDGFPRTVTQAEELDRRLPELGGPLDAVLSFDVPERELLRRLAGRSEQQDRAEDDEQTARYRLDVFTTETQPLVDYYEDRGLLVHVDAVGPVDEVSKRILASLGGRGLGGGAT